MKKLWAQVLALVLLGVQAFILQPLRRIRSIGRSGESRFLGAYSPDRLLPLTKEEVERRFRFNGCIHCGLCDVSCEVLGSVRRAEVGSLSAAVIGYSRSMPDYPYARLSVEHLSACHDCDSCEAACPTGVPLREIIADVREHAGRLTAMDSSERGS